VEGVTRPPHVTPPLAMLHVDRDRLDLVELAQRNLDQAVEYGANPLSELRRTAYWSWRESLLERAALVDFVSTLPNAPTTFRTDMATLRRLLTGLRAQVDAAVAKAWTDPRA
jgi:hypothetical protein